MTLASPPPALAPDRYRVTGRVDWAHFLPLAAAALVVAVAMAYALARTGLDVRDPLIIPTLLGLPAVAAAAAAAYFGRCRSPAVATLLAVATVGVYYLGSWEIGYRLNVLAFGPAAARAVRELTGVPGALGYVILCCRTPTRAGDLLFVTLRVLTVGVLLSVSLYACRRLAGRVFYDFFHRWANSCAFRFPAADLARVRAAVAARDYAALSGIEKSVTTLISRADGRYVFRLEYLPGPPEYPAYVTIEGPVFARARAVLALLPWLARFTRTLDRQRLIPASDLPAIAAIVGATDVLPRPDQPTSTDGRLAYLPAAHSPAAQQAPAPLTTMIRETGLLGASLVGKAADFRDAPAAASVSFLLRCGEPVAGAPLARTGRPDLSLCLPTSEPDSLAQLKLYSLPNLVLSYAFLAFILLGNVAIFASRAVADSGQVLSAELVRLLAVGCFVAAASLFVFVYFALRPLLGSILSHQFRRRPGFTGGPGRVGLFIIEDFATFHVSKRVPEDLCVCRFDAARRRLVIEGITHRYLIRGQDVQLVLPIAGASSVAVRVDFRVAGVEPCSLALCRTSAIIVLLKGFFPIPILGPLLNRLASLPARRDARKLSKTLGLLDA